MGTRHDGEGTVVCGLPEGVGLMLNTGVVRGQLGLQLCCGWGLTG